MSIQVDWDDDDKTMIGYHFPEQWTWDDFFAAREQAFARLDSVSHKVGIIMHVPPNMTVPPGILTRARSLLRNKHPNTVVVVFVMTSPLLHTIVVSLRSITYIAPVSLELAATLDEARALVRQRLREHAQMT